jgi:uncharacterized protein YjeT (DUF2065 family)
MADELWVAGCLILIIEGLILAAFPSAWQRMMLQLATIDPKQLRTGGIVAMVIGLICLKLVKG